MRGGLLLLPLLLLMGCKDEPDFEARYDKAAEEIEARAKAMDADIAASEAAAKAAGDAESVSEPGIEPGGKIPRVAPEPLPETVNPTNPPPSSGE
ncbi:MULTISPECIES: hypothetical protein [unclassified Sphingopyxis]|uniref:hypothetical protein n=1 Tax=unclassified Sphingopyxis TaxID=2614943 RepID=UPI0028596C62|nr:MULTISPECIES: hypothetical protein [unclassified Sphingopyxis]MDR6832025.1 hypothetical protein [Sphingopyxis sp. BE122]MDR7227767.1 hypothetical protein [Sphingopyxis sp. BE259]